MDLNEEFKKQLDSFIGTYNALKDYPSTLDSLQNFSKKDGSRPAYQDQVDKAKQLLDAFTGHLFDAYVNMREHLKFGLDPADEARFENETDAELKDAINNYK